MKTSKLLLRWYKSFNQNYRGTLEKGETHAYRPWNKMSPSVAPRVESPFIEVPIGTIANQWARNRRRHRTGRFAMHKTVYLFASVMSLALSAKPAAAIKPFVFFNSHTSMCLEPQNDSMLQGTAIVQQPCKASAAQEWIYISLGGAGFQFENALTGMCFDARGGAANHTPIQQWTCNGISNERWQISVSGKGAVGAPAQVQSKVAGSSGYCLDIPGGQRTAGLAMQIYKCNQTVSQSWQLNPAGFLYVPNISNTMNSSTLNAAVYKIGFYGLVPRVTNINNCFAGHTAILQFPSAGTLVEPKNSAVTLRVYNCVKSGL